MKRSIIKLCVVLVIFVTTAVATPTHWRQLEPGMEYTQLSLPSGFHIGRLHALRVDLSKYQLLSASAEEQQSKVSTVAGLVTANHAVAGINGGFFSQELKPLGLRISKFSQRTPLKATPWWSIFYITDNRAYIKSRNQFKSHPGIHFAVQSGPRLIVGGLIPSTLKPGIDDRSAIGITRDGKVVLVVTEHAALTTTALAKKMAASSLEGGLNCRDALNLDGGSSSQMYITTPHYTLDVAGFNAVTDAVLVVKQSEKN